MLRNARPLRGLTPRRLVQLCAPLIGIGILINEAFFVDGQIRGGLLLAAFALMGLPFPLQADKDREGE